MNIPKLKPPERLRKILPNIKTKNIRQTLTTSTRRGRGRHQNYPPYYFQLQKLWQKRKNKHNSSRPCLQHAMVPFRSTVHVITKRTKQTPLIFDGQQYSPPWICKFLYTIYISCWHINKFYYTPDLNLLLYFFSEYK